MSHTKTFLIATAFACLFPTLQAHAQATNVTVFGILDEFAGRQQYAGQAEKKVLNSGGLITSRIGFTGSEDLGGGGASRL